METLFELIKKYGAGKGEQAMWKSVRVISDAVDKHMDEESKKKLSRDIYSTMSGGHYNTEFADEDVQKMYYIDKEGERRNAPFWTHQQTDSIYQGVKSLIPAYNACDFFVTMNMIKSDNAMMLKKWFPNDTEAECAIKVRDMAVAWLDDPDNPFGDEKIWRYLNSR